MNYKLHHIAGVFIKGLAGIAILGGVSTPVVTTTIAHHKSEAHKPAPAKIVSHKVAVAQKPKSQAPAPQPAPAPAPPPPAPVAAPQPRPFSSTSPSPGSGAKTLTPSSPSAGSPPSGGSGGSSLPAATGGYTSTNWSGYVAIAGGYTSISGSWVVPRVSGNGVTTSADSAWIGIGGVFSGDLIQTGTEDTVAPNGTVSSAPFYELLPGPAILIPSINVSAGDSMSATITELSAGNWRISITDATKGQNYTTAVAYSSSLSTAEWIEEDPSYLNGSQVPFDNFGATLFASSLATTGGTSGNIATLNGQPITMVNGASTPIATPSVLTGGGSGFTVTQN